MDRDAEPIEIGGQSIPPGSTRRLEVPVARLPTGTWMHLPVAVVHGRRRGPRVWMDAAIHGDELNGIEIIRLVLRKLDPLAMTGTVVAVPIVNVFGLIGQSRYFADGRDLNRSFPGSPRGSLASQLAHLFLKEIVEPCDFGMDFHSGSGQRINLPQVRCDGDDPETLRLAQAFGAPVILHARRRVGSLRAAARNLGKPVIVYEAGETLRFDEESIEAGYRGTLRILRHLGILKRRGSPRRRRSLFCRKTHWARATKSGLCHMKVQLGSRVARDQDVAVITDTYGGDHSIVRTKIPGVVIGVTSKPLVSRGDALTHIAQPEEPTP